MLQEVFSAIFSTNTVLSKTKIHAALCLTDIDLRLKFGLKKLVDIGTGLPGGVRTHTRQTFLGLHRV